MMYEEQFPTPRFLKRTRDDLAKLSDEAELLHSKMYDIREHCKRILDNSDDIVSDMDTAVRNLSDAMDTIAYAMEDLDILIEDE